MLKKILIVILVLIALPFIIALFVQKEYSVITNITIDKTTAEVFNYVKYLKNQENFSVWAQMDPNMTKRYLGTDGTVGFVSRWESDNEEVGVGEQEIMRIDEGKRIDFELRFYSPFESTDLAFMTTESTSTDQTLVKWGFDGHLDYPMNLLFLFMDFETMIGNDLNQGLVQLKQVLEAE
ncbi:SRPBCC family protein [Shewanella sp. GutDb-MelDb]|uniref:SRPBCC family protein n=1 Tax=Shewanella sp. GutDb-MelDb TaxID=2058316 RepID=UPI000C7CF99D|nr:SRPBCC family protein [Shewanella sp. GutDb-MelDb]PKG56495.1 polyketide cyclase [Shewanella sp. GutDb-MelDb]